MRYEVLASGVADLAGNAVLAPDDRAVVRGFRPARPDARRFDLWSMLPKHNRREDQTGDLRRFIACLQEVTDLLLADVDRFPTIFDLERAPEPFLDLILADLGDPFPFDLDALAKRSRCTARRGPPAASSTRCASSSAPRSRRSPPTPVRPWCWATPSSASTGSWGRRAASRATPSTFGSASRSRTPSATSSGPSSSTYLKPAHTHFVNLVEPAQPAFIDHWELGVSEVGVTTVLH